MTSTHKRNTSPQNQEEEDNQEEKDFVQIPLEAIQKQMKKNTNNTNNTRYRDLENSEKEYFKYEVQKEDLMELSTTLFYVISVLSLIATIYIFGYFVFHYIYSGGDHSEKILLIVYQAILGIFVAISWIIKKHKTANLIMVVILFFGVGAIVGFVFRGHYNSPSTSHH